MKDTFIINRDISSIIYSYLQFKERYWLSLCSKSHFFAFNKYKHPEILTIKDKDLYKLSRRMAKWKNIKFRISILECCGMTPSSVIYSEVKDINMLKLDKINDVSMLRRAYCLDLSFCRKIKDVSALGNVHTLIMHRCYNVTGVSMLGRVHTLVLSRCHKITDVSALMDVKYLNLSGCYRITDISMFQQGHMEELDIYGCFGIKNIPDLSHLMRFYGIH
jgi:hypothetical protein